MSAKKPFSKDIILLNDIESVVNLITSKMRDDVFQNLKRLGAVIGTSGGIDSICLSGPFCKGFWSGKGAWNNDA